MPISYGIFFRSHIELNFRPFRSSAHSINSCFGTLPFKVIFRHSGFLSSSPRLRSQCHCRFRGELSLFGTAANRRRIRLHRGTWDRTREPRRHPTPRAVRYPRRCNNRRAWSNRNGPFHICYYEVNEAGMLSELQLLPTDSNHKKLVNLISKKPFNQCTTGK